MPHEVIMPALGMAQESGLVVAWLKQPGDKVAAGDPLMEVETDKSTMEVEAASDGFLTDVRVAAGESAPVGEVIALISESADGAGETAKSPANGADAAPPASESADEGADAVEGRQVIMPALGMAQDAGKIVAWSKQPGDPVAEGDVLFEVETDKATMEVEADAGGWLAAVYAGDGDEVPVGQVIAVISKAKPDSPVVRKTPPPSAKTASTPPPEPPPPAPDRPSKAAAKPPAPSPARGVTAPEPSSGRVLASPKARRLAGERGLDLRRLFDAAGGAPIHVGDLDRLAEVVASAAPVSSSGAAAATAEAERRVEARVPSAAVDAFAGALGPDAPSLWALHAALAAGAFRAATGANTVALRVERPGAAKPATLVDPDLGGGEAQEEASPSLILRDLAGSHLTALRLGPGSAPVLTLAREGDAFTAALDFRDAQMDPETAITLITGFAERLEDPLRQLL